MANTERPDTSNKYLIGCVMCDNDKCVRGSDQCNAIQWEKRKLKEWEENQDDNR